MLKKLIFVPDKSGTDVALLIIRLGLGIMFMLYGWGKITGGPEKWTGLGEAMENLGITFGYTFWGFMAAFSEFFGGLMITLGLFTRASAFLLLFTMFVATMGHWIEYAPEGDAVWSLKRMIMSGGHSLELGVVFLGLLLAGPGKFSLDASLFKQPAN
jgi:putative oxidoreductase